MSSDITLVGPCERVGHHDEIVALLVGRDAEALSRFGAPLWRSPGIQGLS